MKYFTQCNVSAWFDTHWLLPLQLNSIAVVVILRSVVNKHSSLNPHFIVQSNTVFNKKSRHCGWLI